MPCTSHTHPHVNHLYFILVAVVVVFTSPIKAQQPPPWPDSNQNYNSPMATALIVMIIVFFSVGFISVYLRHFLACFGFRAYGGGRRGGGNHIGGQTRHPPRGLDPTIINAFPTFLYSDVKVHRVGKTTSLECAICITEFTDNEILQLLPKCNHVFHPHCVGPWFASHVTCPVCRANLEIPVHDQRTINFHQRFEQPSSGDESEPSNHGLNQNDSHPRDVIVRVEPPPEITAKSPIQDIMKGLSESGRMIRLPRSHSTGHSLVEDSERFTLRLPDEVRNKLVNDGNNNQLCGLPAAIVSPRIGYRVSSVGCGTMQGKPDRWRFSMSPPFISRPGTPKSEVAMDCSYTTSSKNNNTSGNNNVSGGILRSPINLLKSMRSPNKSPLHHVGRCNDIGERSSDRLWANPITLQHLESEDNNQKS